MSRALERCLYKGELGWDIDLSRGKDGPTSFLANFPGAFLKDDVGARFVENQPKDGDQSGVVNDLDVEDPSPKNK